LNFKSVETLTPCDHVEFQISQHRNSLFFLPTTLSNCRAHTLLCLVMSISSLFTILTPTPLSLLISPLCVLLSIFVHVCCTHTPHLQAVLTSYPQAYVVSLCVLSASIIHVHCTHTHTPFLSSSVCSCPLPMFAECMLSSSLIALSYSHVDFSPSLKLVHSFVLPYPNSPYSSPSLVGVLSSFLICIRHTHFDNGQQPTNEDKQERQ